MAKCELCGGEVSEKSRNYRHHRKLFVLFRLGFDNWDQSSNTIKTTAEQFRKMILIAAGYSNVFSDLDGNLIVEAQSISYAKMGAKMFEQCYKDCLAVIADRLLKCGKDDLHDMVMLEF